MRNKFELQDYEAVTPSPNRRRLCLFDTENDSQAIHTVADGHSPNTFQSPSIDAARLKNRVKYATTNQTVLPEHSKLKRGHSLSYLGLFVFTFLVYFRPYELFASLAWLSKSAFIVAAITLAIFIPTQFALENRITVRPREVKLAMGLLLTGLLSIPLALDPPRAFLSLIEFFKVIVMFIVAANVVHTEKRLNALMLLVLLASCVLSVAALNDYGHGHLALQGRRIAGLIGGLFNNPNDLALHLVTMFPISFAFFLASRGPLKKSIYLICSLLLMAGLVATFSRGGFLGFVCVVGFLAWKLARRSRLIFGSVVLTMVVAALALAPSAYRSRLATTSDDSAVARTDDLKRSVLVAARHPLFGVGMDNYILYSNTNKATHNAYTQVASEMGLAALLIYVLFLVTPYSYLRQIDEATGVSKCKPPVYYLAIGLQASLVGYMVISFFASVAYLWYAYYLVAYSVSLRRIYSKLAKDSALAPALRQDSAEMSLTRERSPIHSDETVVVGGN